MSVQTADSDPTTSCTCIQDPVHSMPVNGVGYPGIDLSSPDDAPSSTCLKGERDADCPNDNGPPHPIPTHDDAISPTLIQSGGQDGYSRDDKPPCHPMHLTFCTTCPEIHDHYRIRCGCAGNDSHPMHVDGAKHRLWCSPCMKYCAQDTVCEEALPIERLSVPMRFAISSRDM